MRLSSSLAAVSLSALLMSACGGPTAPPTPAVVSAASSTSLSGTAGAAVTPLPSVTVTSSKGTPVPNVTVTFAITGGGGSVTGASATTGSNGVATVGGWTLGTTAGVNTMTATVATIVPVTFTATGAAGAASKLALTTQPSLLVADRAAFTFQPVVQLQDANGNATAQSGVSVTASITTGGGTLNGTTTETTASNGSAAFTNLSIAGATGSKTLTFSATGLNSVSAPISLTTGSPSSIAINAGNAQSAIQNTAVAVPPSVLVADLDGNPINNVSVTFSIASGGGSVAGPSQKTNTSGIATVTSWTLGPSTGTNTLTASASGLTGSQATFTATATLNATTVAYGGATDKIAVLDPGGSYTPAIAIVTSGAAQAPTVATYTSRATSVAAVDGSGKITGVAAGESWIVASYNSATDSVFVQVTKSAAGPLLRTDLTTYVTKSGTVLSVNFTFDPRTTGVGSALVAVGFETENGMFPSDSATVPAQTPMPTASYSPTSGVYRSTVAAAAGLSAPVVMLKLQLTTGSTGLAGWLTFTAVSVSGTDGSDITSSTTSTRYPVIIR